MPIIKGTSNICFFANLPPTATEEEISDTLRKYGKVERIIYYAGRSDAEVGWAFVKFERRDVAVKVKENFENAAPPSSWGTIADGQKLVAHLVAAQGEKAQKPIQFGQWTEYRTDEGVPYYHNSVTDEKTWIKPVEIAGPQPMPMPMIVPMMPPGMPPMPPGMMPPMPPGMMPPGMMPGMIPPGIVPSDAAAEGAAAAAAASAGPTQDESKVSEGTATPMTKTTHEMELPVQESVEHAVHQVAHFEQAKSALRHSVNDGTAAKAGPMCVTSMDHEDEAKPVALVVDICEPERAPEAASGPAIHRVPKAKGNPAKGQGQLKGKGQGKMKGKAEGKSIQWNGAKGFTDKGWKDAASAWNDWKGDWKGERAPPFRDNAPAKRRK